MHGYCAGSSSVCNYGLRWVPTLNTMARCTHIHLLGGAEQAMLPNRTRPDLVAHLQPLALKGPKLGYRSVYIAEDKLRKLDTRAADTKKERYR